MKLTKLTRNLLPRLRVHSWGGLGSQLYTLSLVLRLKKRFPYRKILVVAHTSGVTRRPSELDWSTFDIDVKIVDDFDLRSTLNSHIGKTLTKSVSMVGSFKTFLDLFLKSTRLLADSNDAMNYQKIKPWTIWLRGHYTRLVIEQEIIAEMYEKLFEESALKDIAEPAILHYRLGDLLTLSQKTPVDFRRVETLLLKVSLPQKECLVITDSNASDYIRFVGESELLRGIAAKHFDSRLTILICANAKIFIGTGSKISIWSAIFRQVVHSKRSFLPVELSWTSQSGLSADWY